MTGPWEDYAAAEAGPWADYQAPSDSPRNDKRRQGKGVGRKVDAAVRGAADMLSFGFADEIAAAGDSLPALMPGGETYGEAFDRNVAEQRGMDQGDRQDVPVSRGVGQGAGLIGGMAVGALTAPSRAVGFVGNALRGAAEGAAFGGLSAAGNATGSVGERSVKAVPGAVLGAGLGAAMAPVSHAVGAGVNALRGRAMPAVERAANALRGRVDTGAARTVAAERRAAGAEPSAINVVGDSARGYVAAAAKRQTPGRDVVQQRADAARVNLPGRVSRQAQRLSTDPRNPREIATELAEGRRAQANADFGAVRGDRVPLTEDAVMALRSADGRQAINEAARASLRSMDPAEREVGAELNRLASEVLDNPGGVEISVGQAQAISEALFDAADAAARAGRNRTAQSLGDMARAVRGTASETVGGYRTALDNYAAESRLMEAAERGEDFLQRNTDEFVADAAGPGQPGNELARATARRAIERRAGEGPAGALSTAESIAIAPEQMARTRAILPEDEAAALERGMQAEVRNYRELQQVAPRSGSPTNLNSQDQEAAANLAGTVATVVGGPKAWGGALINRLRTAGISDRDAQAVAEIATDPARLDELLARMDHTNPGSGNALRSIINQAAGREVGEATQRQPVVSGYIEGVPDSYGAAYAN